MSSLSLIYEGSEPAVYLIPQVPGLAVASMGFEDSARWLLMALGEPRFQPGEEKYAQQFMRRHGLDQQQFPDLHQAARAVLAALDMEPELIP